MTYRPRNDYVLIQVVNKGQTDKGLALPSSSQENKEYVVHAVGPDVENLKVGEKVFMVGSLGDDYAYVPKELDLIIIKQANVVLVIEQDKEIH